MMIDIWVLIAAGVAIVVSLGISIGASERCSTLEQNIDRLLHYSRKQEDRIVGLEKRVQSLEEDVEKVKGEYQINMTSIGKMLAETDRKTDNFNCSVEKHIKELYDIIQRGNESHISVVSDEAPVYRWIFPTEEPNHEKQLIYGQRYTIIGVLKNQSFAGGNPQLCGKPTIGTYEGFWNGHEFLTTNDDIFEKVYAYIRMPSSADVMKKVVQMALANEGCD